MALISEEVDLDLDEGSPNAFARWVVPALIISILLHVVFYMWARQQPFDAFSEQYYDEIVPRTFQLERVEIDPALLEPVPEEDVREAAAPEAVQLPDERVSFESMMGDIKASPAAPELDNPMLAEKPKIESTTLAEAIDSSETVGAPSAIEDLNSLREDLMTENPPVVGRPILEFGKLDDEAGGNPNQLGDLAGSNTPGFSNLDGLLAQTGPLTDSTAPILMPADLLFDYDSADLRDGALSSLEKLGQLIRRNPQAVFIIEGHTDSFGAQTYNLSLSQRRAESVKRWLVAAMAIEPARIRTMGFGKSRLIASADGTIEEQQINRRVEIVIRSGQAVP